VRSTSPMPRRSSLLWKISLSTSVAITLLLAVAGYFVQAQARAALSQNLETNLRGSFRAYESLWHARADLLGKVSLVLSNMPYVRAAFQTNDRATIQDTAAEIWSKVSKSNDAMFLVTDPHGEVIASLGGPRGMRRNVDAVRDAMPHFPNQSEGFSVQDNGLYEVVVTPVYVQSEAGQGLIDVLVAGFPVNQALAADLRDRTGGSDFVFLENGPPDRFHPDARGYAGRRSTVPARSGRSTRGISRARVRGSGQYTGRHIRNTGGRSADRPQFRRDSTRSRIRSSGSCCRLRWRRFWGGSESVLCWPGAS